MAVKTTRCTGLPSTIGRHVAWTPAATDRNVEGIASRSATNRSGSGDHVIG